MKASHIRTAMLVIALILALPIPLGIVTGLFLWASPYLSLSAILSHKEIVLFHGISLVILIAALIKHRVFCHFLCPTGDLCDHASAFGIKKSWLPKTPSVQKIICVIALLWALLGIPILMILDPINLFYAFFDLFQPISISAKFVKISGLLFVLLISFIIPHIWCQKVCPLGGLQDLVTDGKNLWKRIYHRRPSPFSLNRRLALSAVAATALGIVGKTVGKANVGEQIRPPAALQNAHFKTTCCRCGNCVKACPTKIIRSTISIHDPLSMALPKISFAQSYCLPDCARCGQVCPSGAIQPFSLEQKQNLVIGIAKIDLSDCLLVQFKECDRCKVACSYDAVVIKESFEELYTYPEIVADRCVGCGACEIICPTKVITIYPI